MPYDLFPEVEREAMSRASGSIGVGDPSAFTGFGRGAGMYTMRGFADTARSVDLLGSVAPILLDKLTGGTQRQDQYFAEHDDVFNRAVDYWTPNPGEVGAAGQIVGSLAGALPLVIINPAAAVASTQLSTGEDLVRQGVGAGAAQAVGAIQGASLAVGLRLPYLGKTLASRVASGAAGNVLQGSVGAGMSSAVLKATSNEKAAEAFNPFDPTQRSIDLLMGAAFGGLAHLDAKAQSRLQDNIPQESKDAILTLNQARHLEDVATTGKASPEDLTRGVLAVKTAADQLLRGEPVNVEQITQGMVHEADPARVVIQAEAAVEAGKQAKSIINEAILTNEALRIAQETPGFQRTPEQMIALRAGQPTVEGAPDLARAVEIANKPGFLRTAEEKIFLENALQGRAFDHLLSPIEQTAAVDLRANATKLAELDAQITDMTANRSQIISDTANDLKATQGLKAREAKKQAEALYEAKLAELTNAKNAAQTAQNGLGATRPETVTGVSAAGQSLDGAGKTQPAEASPKDPIVETASRIAVERPDMQIPTGEVDAEGKAVTMRADEFMAQAEETARLTKTDASLFKTAITCLLGVL